ECSPPSCSSCAPVARRSPSAHAFWPLVEAHSVTWYSAVPTIPEILLVRAASDHAPSRIGLRFVRSCSAALAPATLKQLEDRFGAPVLEAHGITEASHQVTSNPLPPGPRKPGSVGRGTNVEVALMGDDGALLQSGTRVKWWCAEQTSCTAILGIPKPTRRRSQRMVSNGRPGGSRSRRVSQADRSHQGIDQSRW